MKKRYVVLLAFAVLLLVVIALPILNPKDTMPYAILLVHGREDIAISLDRSQQLNALWKGSQLVIFEKAGHTPHEEYPEKFNQLASEFLSR